MLKETSNRPSVRAVGTTEFYKLQCMLFIIRCTMWWYLPSYDLSAHQIRAAHMFLLVLLAIVSILFADMEYEANTIADEYHVFSLY